MSSHNQPLRTLVGAIKPAVVAAGFTALVAGAAWSADSPVRRARPVAMPQDAPQVPGHVTAGNVTIQLSNKPDKWMLVTRTPTAGNGDVFSINTGLSRTECVRARWAVGSAPDPSTKKHTYQVPDPDCESKGLETVPHLTYTFCRPLPREMDLTSQIWVSVPRTHARCINATTGEEVTTLPPDPPDWP